MNGENCCHTFGGYFVARFSKIMLHHCFVNSEVSAKGIKITSDSVFEIGSITNVFTHYLVIKLVEMGNVSLEILVAESIPEFGQFVKEFIALTHPLSQSPAVRDHINGPEPATFGKWLDSASSKILLGLHLEKILSLFIQPFTGNRPPAPRRWKLPHNPLDCHS